MHRSMLAPPAEAEPPDRKSGVLTRSRPQKRHRDASGLPGYGAGRATGGLEMTFRRPGKKLTPEFGRVADTYVATGPLAK